MPPVKGEGMRGLAVFISDIRNCKYPVKSLKHADSFCSVEIGGVGTCLDIVMLDLQT